MSQEEQVEQLLAQLNDESLLKLKANTRAAHSSSAAAAATKDDLDHSLLVRFAKLKSSSSSPAAEILKPQKTIKRKESAGSEEDLDNKIDDNDGDGDDDEVENLLSSILDEVELEKKFHNVEEEADFDDEDEDELDGHDMVGKCWNITQLKEELIKACIAEKRIAKEAVKVATQVDEKLLKCKQGNKWGIL